MVSEAAESIGELEAAYRHDALDRIGGGVGELVLSRGFQAGIVRFSPELLLSWTSSDISNHDFGVPEDASRSDRPAYSPGATTTLGLGVTGIAELTEDWRAILSVTGEFLDSNVRRSPIVEDETVLSGFVALTYALESSGLSPRSRRNRPLVWQLRDVKHLSFGRWRRRPGARGDAPP